MVFNIDSDGNTQSVDQTPQIVFDRAEPVEPKKSEDGAAALFPENPKREVVIEKIVEKTVETPPEPKKTVVMEAKKNTPPPSNKKGQTASSKSFLFFFFLLGVFLLFVFYALIFFAVIKGDVSNPLLGLLGIKPEGFKTMLLSMTNMIFGGVCLLLFLTALVFVFRWLLTSKEAINRGKLLGKFGLYSFLFFLCSAVWVFLYWFIADTIEDKTDKDEVDTTLIMTFPENVIGLTAPQKIEFDIGSRLFKEINPKFIKQISWDFDGDGTMDASGPKVVYRFLNKGDNDGRFLVKAHVYYFSENGKEELSFLTTREIIISNEAVISKFSASVEVGELPLTVEFNGNESKDPDGDVILYEWDFDGDGEFEIKGEDATQEKTFDQIGEHTIRLRVTGTNNDFDISEKTIKVKSPEGNLRAEINADSPLEGVGPFKITFDGSQSFVKEGQITKFEWFVEGDKEPFVGRKFQRVFRDPGSYEISLTIESDLGERHKEIKTVHVLEDDSELELKIKTLPKIVSEDDVLRGVAPFEVSFDASDSQVKNALEWQWDFENDGIADAFSMAAQTIYREPGKYSVKLVIVDSSEKVHEKIQEIIVESSGVQAKISAQPTAGEVPLVVNFDGSGSLVDEGEIIDYIWEFPGQDPIHYKAQISYLFKTIGQFPVKLTVLTSKGKMSTTEMIVSSRAPTVTADFIFTPLTGYAPLEVQFSPKSTKGRVVEYLWDFGDGYTWKSSKSTPQKHIFTKPGVYRVKLQILGDNGMVSFTEKTIKVRE